MRLDAPGPYSLDALAALPRPTLFSTDATIWRTRLVDWFEQETGRTLYPAQVETLLIEALAYAMAMLGEEASATAMQHLVAFADMGGLERLGVNRSTPRLPASAARCTLQFALASARGTSTLIPHGTRVASGTAVFKTSHAATIPAGQTQIAVSAEAEEAGVAGNGFLPGQIAAMLDPLAGVTASNLTQSEGGADHEGPDAYRLRLANAFEKISTGGSQAWYRETAMGVSSAIVDCAVVRPQPCFVDLFPLTNAGAAGPELRAIVAATFAATERLDIRFGDLVTVKAAVAVTSAPVITVRVRGALPAIAADAAAAATAVLSVWRTRLGATVAPSEIEAAIRSLTGVVDVEVSGLGFMQLDADEFLAASPPVINLVVLQ